MFVYCVNLHCTEKIACVYNNNVTCVTDIGTFYVEDVGRQNKSLTLTPRRHGFTRAILRVTTNLLKLCIWLS